MANRYANLVGSNKIKDEWQKINQGFDAVEADMNQKAAVADLTNLQNTVNDHIGAGGNAHAVATDQQAGFMSAQDKQKLDGVEAGAQVNQNAFAKVNDVEAADPSDELTITGGTGITVTTNPNTKEVIVTATGQSTPGPHGSSHTEHGADPIPTATTTEGGLMSAADKVKLDGATYAATAGTLVQRDSSGRLKAAAPAAADDVATKGYVDDMPHFMYRNAIINGNFDIWQRGEAFFNPPTPTYTADRFFSSASADGGVFPSIAHFRAQMASGELVGSRYCYSINFDGPGSNFGPNASYGIFQRIEHGARYLCGNGRKVTVSFYAYSNIPGKRIGVNLKQKYGSGGSPSPDDILYGSVFTLTDAWTRYTVTFDTVSLVGKTFGTQENDNLQLGFYIMWGSNIAGELVAGGTSPEDFRGNGFVNIAQVQVNVGDVALPFQPRSLAEELALCQRYFWRMKAEQLFAQFGAGTCTSTTKAIITIPFRTIMRVVPTVSWGGSFGLAVGAQSIPVTNMAVGGWAATTHTVGLDVTVADGLTPGYGVVLSSLDTSAYIDFDAEL